MVTVAIGRHGMASPWPPHRRLGHHAMRLHLQAHQHERRLRVGQGIDLLAKQQVDERRLEIFDRLRAALGPIRRHKHCVCTCVLHQVDNRAQRQQSTQDVPGWWSPIQPSSRSTRPPLQRGGEGLRSRHTGLRTRVDLRKGSVPLLLPSSSLSQPLAWVPLMCSGRAGRGEAAVRRAWAAAAERAARSELVARERGRSMCLCLR